MTDEEPSAEADAIAQHAAGRVALRAPSWVVTVVCALAALATWLLLIQQWRPPKETKGLTEEELQAKVMDDPWALAALVALKILPAMGGVVLLILYAYRRAAVRRGELRPPPPRPAPRVALPLMGAVGLFVLYLIASMTAASNAGADLGTRLMAMGGAGLPFAVAVVWLRARRPPAAPPIGVGSRLVAAGRVYVVASTVVVALGLTAFVVLKYVFGIDPQAQTLVGEATGGTDSRFLWILVFFGVLVAPFIEEAMFRGLLYPALRAVGGPTLAAFSLAILFAVMHEASPHAFLPLLGLALLLAGLFEGTDSLLAVTVVHALNNLTSLVPILLVRT